MRHTHVCSVLDNTWRNDSSLIYIELKMHKKRADEKCQVKKMLIVKKTNSTKQKHVFVRAKDEIEKRRANIENKQTKNNIATIFIIVKEE